MNLLCILYQVFTIYQRSDSETMHFFGCASIPLWFCSSPSMSIETPPPRSGIDGRSTFLGLCISRFIHAALGSRSSFVHLYFKHSSPKHSRLFAKVQTNLLRLAFDTRRRMHVRHFPFAYIWTKRLVLEGWMRYCWIGNLKKSGAFHIIIPKRDRGAAECLKLVSLSERL